jgi:hypothetical protein
MDFTFLIILALYVCDQIEKFIYYLHQKNIDLYNYIFPPDGWFIYSLNMTIFILCSIMNTVLDYLETASGIHYVAQDEFYR